jgi:hypothetical protein
VIRPGRRYDNTFDDCPIRLLLRGIAMTYKVGFFWWEKIAAGYQIILYRNYPIGDDEMGKNSHFTVWENAKKTKQMEGNYNTYPRGRVTFNPAFHRAEVYLGEWVVPGLLKEQIINLFKLDKSAEWIYDQHYDMDNPSEHLGGDPEEFVDR